MFLKTSKKKILRAKRYNLSKMINFWELTRCELIYLISLKEVWIIFFLFFKINVEW
jgi:hypothetical protein